MKPGRTLARARGVMRERDNLPAVVFYAGRRALILHQDGPEHETVAATRARLEYHGYVVITVPEDPSPFLGAASAPLRAWALQTLASAAYERKRQETPAQ